MTRNGVPVWFFPPNRHDLAERFATDPAYRLELVSKNYQLRRASKNYRLKLASKKEGA